MKEAVNANMIVLARESRGWNQAELAEKIGMSPTNLSKIERNNIGIAEEMVEQISKATHYPQEFFFLPGNLIPANLAYRKRQNVPMKIIGPIEAKINVIRRHVQFVITALIKPEVNLPTHEINEKQTPQKIASTVRRAWQIDEPVINDLSKLVEKVGVVIIGFNFSTERVDSRSILTDERHPIIFLNSTLLGDRQRFSLAYELGHLVMHTFNVIPHDRDISHEANLFAAEFLMPASEIIKDFKDGISIPLLGELKRKWKVSMISLLYRADGLGLITPNQKRYLVQQFNQLKIRRREPIELDIPSEQPHLMKKWITEYRSKKKLGIVEMAALFCLNFDEFIELYS